MLKIIAVLAFSLFSIAPAAPVVKAAAADCCGKSCCNSTCTGATCEKCCSDCGSCCATGASCCN